MRSLTVYGSCEKRSRTHCASTRRLKSSCSLEGESLALIGPFERLGHRRIIIVDESEHFGLQVLHACEGAACEQLADQDRKPDLDLIHPRTMIGGVMEDHLVGGIAQKGSSTGHQGQNAVLAFLA